MFELAGQLAADAGMVVAGSFVPIAQMPRKSHAADSSARTPIALEELVPPGQRDPELARELSTRLAHGREVCDVSVRLGDALFEPSSRVQRIGSVDPRGWIAGDHRPPLHGRDRRSPRELSLYADELFVRTRRAECVFVVGPLCRELDRVLADEPVEPEPARVPAAGKVRRREQ